MAKTRTDQMVDRLRYLQGSTPDVEASAVVSVDGLIMASSLPAGVEEDRVSAMSAAMLSLGERIAGELGRGSLDQVYIHGDEGYVLLMASGHGCGADRAGPRAGQAGARPAGDAPGGGGPGAAGRVRATGANPRSTTDEPVGRSSQDGPPHRL